MESGPRSGGPEKEILIPYYRGTISLSGREKIIGTVWQSRGRQFDPGQLHHLISLISPDNEEIFGILFFPV
jgi:hypothetical protein